jgi:hypothetical protein
MATLVKFQDFAEQLGKGIHNLSTDTHKVFLCNAANAPVNTNTALANLTTISYANISGAAAPTLTKQYTESGGTGTYAADALVITATGAVPTFRYYGIYNDTATSPADALICFWDHGSDVTLANTETFTITFGADATMGTIFTVA